MKILTEANAFSSAVAVPEGGEARNAASVEGPFQALANRTRNLLNRLTALEAMSKCMLRLAGTNLPDSAVITPTIYQQSGGYSVDGFNNVVVPAPGKYRVSVSAYARHSNTAILQSLGIFAMPTPTALTGNNYCAYAVRTVSNDIDVQLSGFAFVDVVSAGGTIVIQAAPGGGGTMTLRTLYNNVAMIERVF